MSELASRVVLRERTIEIFDYLRFLKLVIDSSAEMKTASMKTGKSFEKELTHTLKANCYLLLYNIIEATITTAIEDIHRAIRTDMKKPGKSIELDKMNAKIFQHVLNRFKAVGGTQISSTAVAPSGHLILEYWLDDYAKRVQDNKNYFFSGNVDGRKMVEVAKTFGFDVYGHESKMKHNGLLTAKSKRNELAHGSVSFTSCGKDVALAELLRDTVGSLKALRHYIGAVEEFISDEGYAKPIKGPTKPSIVVPQPLPA